MTRCIIVISLLIGHLPLSGQVRDDFQVIKERVIAELMKTEVDDQAVEQVLADLKTDGSFSSINYEDLSRRAGFPHRRHTANMVFLARAYCRATSKYYQSDAVKEKVTRSLHHWVKHDYFGDNWHNNQISTPTNLVHFMLLMGDEMPSDLVAGSQPMIGRAHMNASGARPSGDRIVIAGILAKNLLFLGDRQKFDEIIRLIEGEVKFSTGKRGMQHDYSFHHRIDRVNNTTSYGYTKYANVFGEWSYYVANTKYQFAQDKINHLVDYYLDGVFKQQVYGIYPDISVKNRSITHRVSDWSPRGTLEIDRLLFSTDYRSDELLHILSLRQHKEKPRDSFRKFFWQTEHFVCQRPDFYTTVRMYSNRNRNMEKPYNGPGKPTHHRADGTNYIQLEGNEYHNIWPVYDWQKISGTTILQKPKWHPIELIQMDGLTDFVGAATDGQIGTVAFDFISPHDRTKAKKSWFFFDEEYVCLGADISSEADSPVVTTLDQALLKDEVLIVQNDKIQTIPSGTHRIEVNGVYHNRIGFVLPIPTTLQISNQIETGRWSDITDQKNISETLIEKEVFTAYLDHGPDPDSTGYTYMVVPAIDPEVFAKATSDFRNIEIICNSNEMQAVHHKEMQLGQVVFYRAGQISVTPEISLSLASPGIIIVAHREEKITKLTVADPSRKLAKFILALSGHQQINHTDVESTFLSDDNETRLIIDLPKGVYAGSSVVLELNQ